MMTESTYGSASDGRRGSEPISRTKVDPRYIFYRLYTKEGALESRNPIYSDDLFISCIVSKSVTPPHTAASLKEHLCWVEGFEVPEYCDLYLSLSEKTPVEDSTRISLRGKDPGPGTSKFEPIALVIDVSAAVENQSPPASMVESQELPNWPKEERYIYYRVYNQKGEIASKASFDETDISLGRLNVFSVPPPRTVDCLKSCLMKVEEVPDSNLDVQIFEDEAGETAMSAGDEFPLLSDTCPGLTEDEPIAFVYRPQKKISPAQPQASTPQELPQDLSFSKQLRATYTYDWGKRDPAWHSPVAGEIFKTDGVPRTEIYKVLNDKYPCYVAINSSGRKAFLPQGHAKMF